MIKRPPMPSRVFRLLCIAGLLTCTAVAALWMRGSLFHITDGAAIFARGYGLYASSYGGALSISCSVNRRQTIDDRAEMNVQSQRIDPAKWWAREGRFRTDVERWHCAALGVRLGIGHPDKVYPNGRWIPLQVDLPHWLLLILSLIFSGAMRRGHRRALRRERLAAGLCPKCGYDVRATPGRCPECGSVAGPMNRVKDFLRACFISHRTRPCPAMLGCSM